MIDKRGCIGSGAADWLVIFRLAIVIVLAALAALAIHASRG